MSFPYFESLGFSTPQRVQRIVGVSVVVSFFALSTSLSRLCLTTYYVNPPTFLLTTIFHVYLIIGLKKELGVLSYYQVVNPPGHISIQQPDRSFTTKLGTAVGACVLAILWTACFALTIVTLVLQTPWNRYRNGTRVTTIHVLEMLASLWEAGTFAFMGLVCFKGRIRWHMTMARMTGRTQLPVASGSGPSTGHH